MRRVLRWRFYRWSADGDTVGWDVNGDINVSISKAEYVKLVAAIPMEYRWMSAETVDAPRLQLWTVNWKTGENRKVVFNIEEAA